MRSGIPHSDHALRDGADMAHLAAQKLHSVLHGKTAVRRGDYARISVLSEGQEDHKLYGCGRDGL